MREARDGDFQAHVLKWRTREKLAKKEPAFKNKNYWTFWKM